MTRYSDHDPMLSIVVPMYNEAAVLPAFLERVNSVVTDLGVSHEVIFVDDGSDDDSSAIIQAECNRNARIRLVQLSRNFGKEVALTAGLDHAVGQAVVPLDADLQDPPELIEQMLAEWRAGYDVVLAVRSRRVNDGWFKRKSAAAFYATINKLSGINIPPEAGDFRLMDRRVVEEVRGLRERSRFMKGIFAWVGFSHSVVEYERPLRAAGTTKFNFWKLWNFALDGITGFSTVPLRLAGYIGFLTAITSILYGTYLVYRTLVSGVDLPGYASLMVAVLFLGGLQLMVLGIIGEYLGRNYTDCKNRPLYVVKDRAGFGENETGGAIEHGRVVESGAS